MLSGPLITRTTEPEAPSERRSFAFLNFEISRGAMSIVDQAIVSATNFLTAWAVARWCGKMELGVYFLAWTVVLFVTAAQGNLVSVPYTILHRRRTGDELASYAGSSLIHQLATSVAVAVLLLLLDAAVFAGFGPEEFRPVGWTLLCVTPLLLAREYARRLAFAHLRISLATVLDCVASALQILVIAVLAYTSKLTTTTAYITMGFACLPSLVVALLTLRIRMTYNFSRIVADWRENWAFGKWGLASQLFGLSAYFLPWLLAEVHSRAETGELGACNHLVGLSNLFVIGLCNYVTPRAAEAYAAESSRGLVRVLKKTALIFTVVLGAFSLFTVFFGNFIVEFIYGNQYANAGAVVCVLAFAGLLDAFGLTAMNGLLAIKRPATNFAADAVQMVVTLVAAAALVKVYSTLGIALAMLMSRAVGAAWRWHMLRNVLAENSTAAGAAETYLPDASVETTL